MVEEVPIEVVRAKEEVPVRAVKRPAREWEREEMAKRRLLRILEKYEKIASELMEFTEKASERAQEEAVKQVGVKPPIPLTPWIDGTGWIEAILNMHKYAPEELNSYKVHKDLESAYAGFSTAFGSIFTTRKHSLTVNPKRREKYEVVRKYWPSIEIALNFIEDILFWMGESIGEALRKCAGYLGNNTRYYNCVADVLESSLKDEEKDIESKFNALMKEEKDEVIKELTDLYKALLKECARRY